MKKVLTLTVGLMIMASAAMAQSGLYLTLGDCHDSGNGNFVTNACTSNIGTAFTLVASVRLPHAELNFVSAGSVLDMQSAGATLPDWWRVDAGGCRPGAVTALMDPTITPSCLTVWDGGTAIGIFQAQVGNMTNPPLAPNRLRLNAVGALVSATNLTDLTDELGVCKFTVTRASTTTCTGCAVGVSFALNEINFIQSASQGDAINAGDAITNPAIAGSNGAGYQPGGPGTAATATNNRTWGAIKALYR